MGKSVPQITDPGTSSQTIKAADCVSYPGESALVVDSWTGQWGVSATAAASRKPSRACGVSRITYHAQSVAQADEGSSWGPDRLSLGVQPQTMRPWDMYCVGLKIEMQINCYLLEGQCELGLGNWQPGFWHALLYDPGQVTQAVQWDCSHADLLLRRIGHLSFFYSSASSVTREK